MSHRCENKRVDEITFENTPVEVTENVQLKNVLLKLESLSRENEQKLFLKEVVEICIPSNQEKITNVAIKCILHIFIKYSSKRFIKKYLQDIIIQRDIVDIIVTRVAVEILETFRIAKKCNIKLCTDLCNFVCSMQFTTFNCDPLIDILYPLYFKVYCGFIDQFRPDRTCISNQSEELLTLVNIVLKQILIVFGKNIPYLETIKGSFTLNLIFLSHTCLKEERIGFDVKTKAGLILANAFNITPEVYLKKIKHKQCGTIDLIEDYNKTKKIILYGHDLTVFSENEQKIILYSSIINVVSKETLYKMEVNGKILICVLYDALIEHAKRCTSISNLIIEISKNLVNLSKQMKELHLLLMQPRFIQGIIFAWSHIDHFVDAVKLYSKAFFVELVSIAADHQNKGSNVLCEILMENVKRFGSKQTIRFIALESVATKISCTYLLEHCTKLGDELLKVTSDPSISDEAAKAYITIMEKHYSEVDNNTWMETWITPPATLLTMCVHCANICENIITKGFQLHPEILRKIFPKNYIGNLQECEVLLKCLRTARQNSLELVIESPENYNLYWRGLIDKDKLESFMIHQEDEIRITVLAVIIETQKSTELFLNWELDYLIKYIHYNITTQIPHIRRQIISYYKKALTRFNAGFAVLSRNLGNLEKRLEMGHRTPEVLNTITIYRELIDTYKKFLDIFTKYLISNLTFDSNYPRRAVSLELLITIQINLTADKWQSLWTEDDIKNCHSILFDSYESNKKMAAILLKKLPISAIGFTNVDFTFNYMQRCFEFALALKPSKTLSAAYLLQVCATSPFFFDIVQTENERRYDDNPILEMLFVLTDKLILQISTNADVINTRVSSYGLLLSIRHILQTRDMTKNNKEFADLFDNLATICMNLKDYVMPIVCNPSPEGYLPEASEIINESDESVKAQSVLVYAWRTMKEMTLLLAEIIRQSIKFEGQLTMLPVDVIIKVGEFFLDVFIATKHKGVFEQAFVGFSHICDSLWASSNSTLNCLPKKWLEDTLLLCTGETPSDKLCATRRSAGLPFLILALITSEPIIDKTRFHHFVKGLIKVTNNHEESNIEYRTHCMNVLRALFRHTKLGELVMAYIAEVVIVAISGFQSDAWGVRNAATLLYATLMTRIFGVLRTSDGEEISEKNKLTVRVFFMRFPALFHFILETLTIECTKNDSLLLHPVLLILGRLFPSQFDDFNTQMEQYVPHLITCLTNSVYQTRDLAAWATISFISADRTANHLNAMFDKLSEPNVIDNEVHGCLLQVLYIIKYNCEVTDLPISEYLQKTMKILKLVGTSYSHLTASTYMELIMVILKKYTNYEDLEMLKNIVRILSKQITSKVVPITAKGRYYQRRMSLLLYIVINKFEETSLTYSTAINQILCQIYGRDLVMKIYSLNLFIYLNQLQSGFKHALYQTDELQIPKEIIELCDSFGRPAVIKLLTQSHQYVKYFLKEEIKHQHYVRDEEKVLLFLLLNYYPCVIRRLHLSNQETLNMFTRLCNTDNEELVSAVITCMSTLLLHLDYRVLKYESLMQVLIESASPAASDYRRLAVCDFLSKNYILYCNEDNILDGDDLQMMLSIVMVLLEDDELIVRNAMSEFATCLKDKLSRSSGATKQTKSGQRWAVIPEKAREDLLTLSSLILPRERAICFLFGWSCRYFPDPLDNETSEVQLFERGELNTYAENNPFMEYCIVVINRLLWNLEDGLSYEDKSIFIEEHTLLITTILLDALTKYPSPMMLYKTKLSVICALKSAIKFLERFDVNTNFLDEFRTYMNDTIFEYLTKHVVHNDLFSVKWVLKRIYDPVLKTNV
ncbi:thyroid adenoma-associated protein homolog isoform X1 [Diorhabda carinulata]|uniref:thyroid adenoma-associated protein homolog isoform X1 n=1 Tax=Diorhabda carinulata TaxID=1163345 RepID=UPI0025A2D114|nr:thyroid adenoma-associated protein homolog isoform X1 [Diorhabda carinulata]